jgi:hypothetical protein
VKFGRFHRDRNLSSLPKLTQTHQANYQVSIYSRRQLFAITNVEGHLQILRQMLPHARFEVVFDLIGEVNQVKGDRS